MCRSNLGFCVGQWTKLPSGTRHRALSNRASQGRDLGEIRLFTLVFGHHGWHSALVSDHWSEAGAQCVSLMVLRWITQYLFFPEVKKRSGPAESADSSLAESVRCTYFASAARHFSKFGGGAQLHGSPPRKPEQGCGGSGAPLAETPVDVHPTTGAALRRVATHAAGPQLLGSSGDVGGVRHESGGGVRPTGWRSLPRVQEGWTSRMGSNSAHCGRSAMAPSQLAIEQQEKGTEAAARPAVTNHE